MIKEIVGNSYLPQGMVWTWKSGDRLDEGTTLDNSGKYTKKCGSKIPNCIQIQIVQLDQYLPS